MLYADLALSAVSGVAFHIFRHALESGVDLAIDVSYIVEILFAFRLTVVMVLDALPDIAALGAIVNHWMFVPILDAGLDIFANAVAVDVISGPVPVSTVILGILAARDVATRGDAVHSVPVSSALEVTLPVPMVLFVFAVAADLSSRFQ